MRIRARGPADSRPIDIPSAFRSRNPEETAFCERCASGRPPADEALVVDPASLGLRNVAVSLKSISEGLLPPLGQATLDNACCRFDPHVLFVPVGAKVVLKNSDPMSHASMISTLSGTALFTVTIPSGEKAETTAVEFPGILSVTCPIHSWMQAWLIGARHPYVAVTDAGGAARLDRVPAGSHDVVFWHERLGTAVRKAEVTAGQELRLDLDDSDFKKR